MTDECESFAQAGAALHNSLLLKWEQHVNLSPWLVTLLLPPVPSLSHSLTHPALPHSHPSSLSSGSVDCDSCDSTRGSARVLPLLDGPKQGRARKCKDIEVVVMFCWSTTKIFIEKPAVYLAKKWALKCNCTQYFQVACLGFGLF